MIAENIKKIYLGSSPVQKMYLGESLIYPIESAVDDYVMLGTTRDTSDFMIGRGDLITSEPADAIQVHVVAKPDGVNEMYVKSSDVLKVPNSFHSTRAFMMKQITSITKWNIDMSNVINAYAMFYNCVLLKSIDTSNWNTSNMEIMGFLFGGCASLETVDVTNFDTSKAIDLSGMFVGCSKLQNLNVSNFNTSNCTNMQNMFKNCTKFDGAGISYFDTSKVTNMSGMFAGCSSMTSFYSENFVTTNVTDFSEMFSGCSSLEVLNLTKFDLTNCTNITDMFAGCSNVFYFWLSDSFFNSTNITEYDFSDLKMWVNEGSLTKLVQSLPQIWVEKTLKFSSQTYNTMTDEQKSQIQSKGWTIEHLTDF